MLKQREDVVFTASQSKNTSPFDGYVFTAHMATDGVQLARQMMTIHVATNPAVDETISLGTKTYTFKAVPTGDQIAIGADVYLTATNIINKINADKAINLCTAYAIGDLSKLALVAEEAGTPPVFVADGVKVVVDLAWASVIPQAKLEDEDYFKVPLTDVNAKPIVLTERNAGTANNFLY